MICRAVRAVKSRLAALPHVTSVHWGIRRARGHLTGEPCVVVFVREKLTAAQLRRLNRRPLPRSVAVPGFATNRRIRIDVQIGGVGAQFQASDVVRPGTHVSINVGKKRIGSLGGLVQLEDGTLAAVTAGHVVLLAKQKPLVATTPTTQIPLGRPLQNAAGVDMLVVDETADLALVGPVDGDAENIVGSTLFVRNPSNKDLNNRVWVRVLREYAPIASYVEGIDVQASFFRVDGPGEITITGLVAIDAVTQRGDSGAPVLDEKDNVIGFVIGSDDLRTYLMPAKRGLNVLENLRN